jgi:tetratricopeptide (TPR) repeat protein
MRTIAAAVLFALAVTLAAMPRNVYAITPPDDYREFDRKRDKESEKLYKEGRKAYRDGHYREAAKAFLAIVDKDASDIQARLQAAHAFLKDQDFQNCYDNAIELTRQNPAIARAYALAGAALLRSGYIVSSIYSLNQAVKLNPKDALAFGAAAEIDYYEGRAHEAINKAFRAHHLDPDEADFLITIARASARIEMYEQAAYAYQRFLEIVPKADKERRDRIRGLIQFYKYLSGLKVHEIAGPREAEVPFALGNDRRPYITLKINGKDAKFVVDTGSGFTVISKEAAKRLGVAEIARGGHSQGVGGAGKFSIVLSSP